MGKRIVDDKVVDDIDYNQFPEILTQDGELLTEEQVAYSYTREGRRTVGKEYPSPIPMEPPLGYVPAKPLHEQIRDMVQRELSRAAEREGFETMEESDDFEVDDDFDPATPYEQIFEPTQPWPPRPEVEAAEAAAVGGAGGQSPQAPSPSPGPAGAPPAEPLPSSAAK